PGHEACSERTRLHPRAARQGVHRRPAERAVGERLRAGIAGNLRRIEGLARRAASALAPCLAMDGAHTAALRVATGFATRRKRKGPVTRAFVVAGAGFEPA